MIVKTNQKVYQLFQKKAPQGDASISLHPDEEVKQQSQPSEVQPPPQMPEEEKKHTGGYLRVQVIEEPKQGAFMTAQVTDLVLRREQMAVALRKSKRLEILSKKRYPVN